MKKIYSITIPVIILMLIQLISCGAPVMRGPFHNFESYKFNEKSSLIDRVTVPPAFALDYIRKLDERPDYEPYLPGRNEIRIIEEALATLPPLHKSVLKKRLIGIYFIKNFHGSGLTDWIVDSKKTIYTVMYFNASSLKRNISDLLTEKDKTCFISGTDSIDVQINCGKKYSGFTYIVLHEATHVVDYVQRITPYVDFHFKQYMGIRESENNFTSSIWNGYLTSRQQYLFSRRVAFYGFSKPKLRMSEAPDVYRNLARSPFASLYGSLTWAEDLAELVTFYHITHIMKQPYIISVIKNGKPIVTVAPMESPEVQKRISALDIFYKTGGL